MSGADVVHTSLEGFVGVGEAALDDFNARCSHSDVIVVAVRVDDGQRPRLLGVVVDHGFQMLSIGKSGNTNYIGSTIHTFLKYSGGLSRIPVVVVLSLFP